MSTIIMLRKVFICFVGFAMFASSAMADEIRQRIDIPAGELASALQLLAKQSGADLVYRPEQVQGFKTKGVSGEFTTQAAIGRLLEGTPLVLSTDATGAMLIAAPLSLETKTTAASGTAAPNPADSDLRLVQVDRSAVNPDSGAAESRPPAQNAEKTQEVVVTGTHIRGAQSSSLVLTIEQEEMRLSGHHDLGQVIRALPQNFSGGQNPEVAVGATAGGINNQNLSGASSLNLRGLGPDATLTLLNGVRLPYDGTSQATDAAVIPIAAIERMEVLLDGASAIYGSDAVGGVANIILKRDYDGAEVSARYGAATEGGFDQTQYTMVAGKKWESGGFLISYDQAHNNAIRARQRDYLNYVPDTSVTLYPETTQKGALFNGHQALGGAAELGLVVFYTERETDARQQTATLISATHIPPSEIWGVSPALSFDLPKDWSLRIHGFAGRNENKSYVRQFFAATGLLAAESKSGRANESKAMGVEAEGALFSLPGGDARLSVGGGHRENEFQLDNILTGITTIKGSSRSHYGFGEISVPLISAEQNVPGVTRLSINGAVRYEDYNHFGDVTTPKFGLIWGVTRDVELKASWGKSFKVPTLLQQYQESQVILFPATTFGVTGPPAGRTVLVTSGGNRDLDPERAETFTVGLLVRPQFLPGTQVELSWFSVDYTDRVLQPIAPLNQALSNANFTEFVTPAPTVAQQNAAFAAAGLPVGTFTNNFAGAPYNPANVMAIAHNLYTNVANVKASGLDLSVGYAMDLLGGQLRTNANVTWLDGHRQLTGVSPELPAAGVIYFPAKFSGRVGFGWSRGEFTLASHINHIGGVRNTNIATNPRGSSMTTLDIVADRRMTLAVVGDIGLNLAVMNLFDERPPFLQPLQSFNVNYDSTNYSATGRVVSATVTKRF